MGTRRGNTAEAVTRILADHPIFHLAAFAVGQGIELLLHHWPVASGPFGFDKGGDQRMAKVQLVVHLVLQRGQ
ncbi:hypothetical protein D3C76_1765340 [compost metagenome]